MSQQRWHVWRNADSTTCPAHGVVRIVVPEWNPPDGQIPGGGIVAHAPFTAGQPLRQSSYNEVFGTQYVLHGMRPGYNLLLDSDYTSTADRG